MIRQQLHLGNYQQTIDQEIERCQRELWPQRIFAKDPTIWSALAEDAGKISDRLGWLRAPQSSREQITEWKAFAEDVCQHFRHVVLLGMGGSSLAPEVFAKVFGSREGYPVLHVLDSTHPQMVRDFQDRIEMDSTLFIVSSKSGGTIETLSLFAYFYEQSGQRGEQFVAITDPGSSLADLAQRQNFRRVFLAPPDVGGRYSALTCFGLVPAALIGVDIERVLACAEDIGKSCENEEIVENPGVLLGLVLGKMAFIGRDKLTIVASKTVAPVAVWLEQLLAESTGKENVGIVPVVAESVDLASMQDDRLLVSLKLVGESISLGSASLSRADHPTIEIEIDDRQDLGAIFFHWEMATAVAGGVLQIDPFDQPNVELAKKRAQELMQQFASEGQMPAMTATCSEGEIEIYSDSGGEGSCQQQIQRFLATGKAGDYIAVLAYLPSNPQTETLLQKLYTTLKKTNLATTVGYGPRYLHSTGQLHKGDGNRGLFIEITDDSGVDLVVPGKGYHFSHLIAAQALGDYRALLDRERRIIRFHLHNSAQGLEILDNIFAEVIR